MMRKTFAIAAVAVLVFLGGVSQSADSESVISGRKAITISGTMGLPGVTVQGLPGSPVTDENGVYAATVESGWSGRVTPIKVGYRFEPQSRTYSAVSKSLAREDYKAVLLSLTISGNAGASRVTMSGLPGDPVTNVSGDYSVHVGYGWSGIVTPVKEGLAFSPRARTYQQVTADHTNQNYTTKAATFTISGNVGVPGVTLRGLPGGPVSGTGGFYAGKVPYGWTGTVMPVKEGCTFAPPRRTYEKIASDQTNQEYVSRVVPYTISGNAGLPGVTMEGLPGDPITDADGYYSATVECGWTGTVTPKKDDRKFNPASKRYAAVARDLTDEDYIPLTVIISDRIVFGTEPIADVTITADPGGYTATTDRQGCYRVEVPYGWSGMLLMSKPGFEFSPPGISFTRVTTDIDKTAPSGAPPEPFPPRLYEAYPYRSTIPPVDGVLVIPTTSVAPSEFAETSEDIRVMQQILRDLLSEPRMILGVLQDYGDFLGGEGRRHEAFYLQGFGVLFVMEVDFPLSPAAVAGVESEPQSQPAVDPIWQRARQKLYAPRGGGFRSRTSPSQRQQMNFEQFKADLIDTLKHAANIRHVDPNEHIVLTVVGQVPDTGTPMSTPSRGGFSGDAGGWFEGGSYSYSGGSFGSGGGSSYADSRSYARGSGRGQAVRRAPSALGTSATTVLTIQARKADVDAYAQGELDREQFEQRARVFAY